MDRILQLLKKHKVLFVGVGNLLKSDDGVGVYICQELSKNPDLNCLIVESSLEKFIGKINQLNPEILVMIDCMFFPDRDPGYYDILSVKEITPYVLNTHNISLGSIRDFFDMPIYILGIHPGNISFGENMSLTVKSSANKIIKQINQSL